MQRKLIFIFFMRHNFVFKFLNSIMQLKGITCTCTLYFKTSEIITPENVHTQQITFGSLHQIQSDFF